MSFQEKAVSGQIYYVCGLAMLLVYLVPLSLLGPMAVLEALKIDNNLYVQIGLILLIALSGRLASTCQAVLFVPAFFGVVQRFENWHSERRGPRRRPQA
jgi:hypothetical protein